MTEAIIILLAILAALAAAIALLALLVVHAIGEWVRDRETQRERDYIERCRQSAIALAQKQHPEKHHVR